jgi:hypothetical protein
MQLFIQKPNIIDLSDSDSLSTDTDEDLKHGSLEQGIK